MCGRFTLTATPEALNQLFPSLFDGLDLKPNYNVAPTQTVLAVRQSADSGPEPRWLRWGLVPSWATDPKIGSKLINARADTVATKPSFRAAFKKRRCLILADGFFEWKKTGTKTKQPYHLHLTDRRPFCFAGLWEDWDRDGLRIESCTLITTDANKTVQEVHNRMPVIIAPEDYGTWLGAGADSAELLRPCG
jgi:putative SOS response-associated peptidase YedK